MKKVRVLLIVFFLLSTGFFLQQVTAQEKTKAEQDRELKIQQAIEEQKRVLAEEKRAMADSEIEWREQAESLDEMMKDVRVTVESPGRPGTGSRIFIPRGNRSFNMDENFVFTNPDIGSYYLHSINESERTTWDFTRSVKENTFSKNYTFDVEKTVKSVVMSVMGDCKAGEIRVKIIMPNGKSYSDIVIDEFGNLNWRKSFTISETENQDKTGVWKFQVISTNATGYFKISLQSS